MHPEPRVNYKIESISGPERLKQQLLFIAEIDRLKRIFRQTKLVGTNEPENDAEHSWHIATMAVLLSEYANDQNLDMQKIMTMLLIHDIVEIDAGDTFAYDAVGNLDKLEREEKAAARIFGLLPKAEGQFYIGLWKEFDDMQTPDAKYAAAMDRLQPMMLNWLNGGGTWQEHGITRDQVRTRNCKIAEGSEALWAFAQQIIADGVAQGWILP